MQRLLVVVLLVCVAVLIDGAPMPVNRPGKRLFTSELIDKTIANFQQLMKDSDLANLFAGTFPNTLDTTTVFHGDSDVLPGGGPDTWVFTGDIEGMWLRDSAGQIRPYIPFASHDPAFGAMLVGLARRMIHSVLLDAYANAFNYRNNGKGWQRDTRSPPMSPGVFEGKWELDSLCYVMDTVYRIHHQTHDSSFLTDGRYAQAMDRIYHVLRYQQQPPEHHQRTDPLYYRFARGNIPGGPRSSGGYARTGMVACSFRPSDDETQYGFLVPANAFAVVALRRTASIYTRVLRNHTGAELFTQLAAEIERGVRSHGLVPSPLDASKKIFAYEVDGRGNANVMDEANVPSLLSLPYLEYCDIDDEVYVNTRDYIFSRHNPYNAHGSVAHGVGSPHTGRDTIWPMSIIMRAFTSNDDAEILECLQHLKRSSAGTGLLHEAFHKDDASRFSRPWFSWTNSLFGQLIVRLAATKPHLLFDEEHLNQHRAQWSILKMHIRGERPLVASASEHAMGA